MLACGPEPQNLNADAIVPESGLREQVGLALHSADSWFIHDVDSVGHFSYEYSGVQHAPVAGDNEIRQLMATHLLGEMAHDEPSFLALHELNLAFVMRSYYQDTPGAHAAIVFDGVSKLGGVAAALHALLASPHYSEYRPQASRLARTIMSLMGSDGSLVPWVVPPRGEYNANYLLTFYSGEAVLALAEFARVDSNQAALHAAERAEAYYMDRYATHIATNFFPPYVPWHTMALAELYGITGKAPYATAAFVMNDALLTIQDTAVYVGRFYDREHPEYGEPRAASDGLYTEGMAYAYEMALARGDTGRARRYRRAIQFAATNLLSLQIQIPDLTNPAKDGAMVGALRANADDLVVRIDDTQSAMDAFRKILQVWN